MRSRLLLSLLFSVTCACAGPSVTGTTSPAAPSTTVASTTPEGPAATTLTAPRSPPDAKEIYARLRPDLARCFEQGKKSTAEMTDGKLTLHASIDASGKTTCAIPSDATGLTQEVQDCMSARFTAERFEQGPPWSAAVPIAVKSSALQLGEPAAETARIDSIETFRMPDAFEVLEALVPELEACVHDLPRTGARTILAGARVGPDGRATCALASSAGPLPPAVADCTAAVLRRAKFPPPKNGAGLVLVPINVLSREPPPPSPPRRGITIRPGTRVLMVGDSMVTSGLGVYLKEHVVARGGTLIPISKGSSTTQSWRESPDLQELIARLRPDVVIIALAANELFIPNPRARTQDIRAIVKRVGERPCLWIGPPPWLPEKGILRVIRESSAPCVFYDSSNLALERQPDGIHPTLAGARTWAEAVWHDAFAAAD